MWEYKKFRTQEFTELILFFMKMYQPDVYVEVGLGKGSNFNFTSHIPKISIGLDTNPKAIASIIKRENTRLYQMNSLEFIKEKDNSFFIDLLFIDADHRKQAVLQDFDNLASFVTPQTGLILLHDTYPSSPYMEQDGYSSTAWQAAKMIHKSRKYAKYEIVTLPGPYAGLSIIRNASQHLHWRKS